MSWQPHTITTDEVVEPAPVTALAALFDNGLPAPSPGDVLPPLWHWAALARWPVSSVLDTDGHPERGSFLPPVALPRRMFAGGEVAWHAPVTIGSTIRRQARVASVTEKSGRSGPMTIVVVRTRLYDSQGRLAVEETQDIVYRAAGAVAAAEPSAAEAAGLAPVGSPLVRADDWDWHLTTDPTILMRFSAATSNAHRIHYDWPYATRVEGYPGLVVHGPLMTLALAEVARWETGGQQASRLIHRNRAPLFCGHPARLRRLPADGPVELALFSNQAREPGSTLRLEYPHGKA